MSRESIFMDGWMDTHVAVFFFLFVHCSDGAGWDGKRDKAVGSVIQ